MNKLIIITILFSLLYSCSQNPDTNSEESHSHATHYYTCSMHPSVKENSPGKCPICHMKLTKVEKAQASKELKTLKHKERQWRCENYPDVTSMKEDLCPIDGTKMVLVDHFKKRASSVVAKVKLNKSQSKHFSPDYFPVTNMIMSKKVRLLGTVLQSEERESNVTARISGRVERVYVKSTGSLVQEGDPVIDLYSPRLITAGEEYLLARRSYLSSKSKEFKDMLIQSVERLEQWGIKKEQYQLWYKNSKVPKNITIHSNVTGIVRKRNASVGKYFKEGENFFELSDLSYVWVEMAVYEQDSALVKIGQEVELEFSALPGNTTKGRIDFINPVLDTKSRTLKVRATIKNTKNKLKPGMIANAVLNIKIEGEPLVIPRSAIIDTGKRKVVWRKVGESQYQAQTVRTGFESDGYIEIIAGLEEGDDVVIEGNFMLDAQAQLFGGYEDFGVGD